MVRCTDGAVSFPPSMRTTKFHTHTKQQAKLQFYISWSLKFWIATWKTKDSAPNDGKHFLILYNTKNKKYILYKVDNSLCGWAFHLLWRIHIKPANQPTVTVVTVLPEKVGHPPYTECNPNRTIKKPSTNRNSFTPTGTFTASAFTNSNSTHFYGHMLNGILSTSDNCTK